MMKYLQKLGKSLMLPVAVLPAAGILYGIGYWIDPVGWGSESAIAAFCIKAASALIDQMAILFAIGVAVGMADDHDGTAALSGLVSWLMITTLLSPAAVAQFKGIPVEEVPAAFGKIQNQFIGILCGIIGSTCYNKFKGTQLPDALAFFSGKRCVAIVSSLVSIVTALILFFIWPIVFAGLVAFGTALVNLGPLGAALHAFFNRLLIPVGLHHTVNSVFWFDVANINDLGLFWSGAEGAVKGVTGQYMAGFFPVMMYGLPAGALAMYHCAKPGKKKIAAGLLFSAAVSSFFTGITEPLEFAFMFLAPGLYLVHAILAGISAFVVSILGIRVGFNFSAGLVDYILSFKAPMANKPLMMIPVGLVFAVIYYVTFRFVITKFNLKTPGREDDDDTEAELNATLANNDFTAVAAAVLAGLGGKENVKSLDNCITRLRLEVKDYTKVDEKKIKSAGVAGVIRPSKTAVQVIVGTKVQFVADEMKKML
ncbi:MAG: N-acetylglucosamine-specific PTS transporter subunit IIBC [Lachnospiraceae bacterium]|nr:N-acetylglucosamine-specific PTS transporter subunit IIBC [Lachnospiraceae bacterium]